MSEQRIGSFLAKQGRRATDFFHIATKAAICRDPDTGARSFNNSAEHLESELDKSLARMGVDHVDLFYVHRRQPELPIEEVAGTLGRLVEKGKIKTSGFLKSRRLLCAGQIKSIMWRRYNLNIHYQHARLNLAFPRPVQNWAQHWLRSARWGARF